MILNPFVFFCQISLIIVFSISSLGKFSQLDLFQSAIISFKIIPRSWTRPISYIFLATEIGIVLLCIVGGFATLIGFNIALILLSSFSVALFSVLFRNLSVACNCFGSSESIVTRFDLVRNLGLILCCLFGIWGYLYGSTIFLSLPNIMIVFMLSTICVTMVLNLKDLFEIFRKPISLNIE